MIREIDLTELKLQYDTLLVPFKIQSENVSDTFFARGTD